MDETIIYKSLADCKNCGREPNITWLQDIAGFPGWRIMCDCGKMMFINVLDRHEKHDKLMEILKAWNGGNELSVLR